MPRYRKNNKNKQKNKNKKINNSNSKKDNEPIENKKEEDTTCQLIENDENKPNSENIEKITEFCVNVDNSSNCDIVSKSTDFEIKESETELVEEIDLQEETSVDFNDDSEDIEIIDVTQLKFTNVEDLINESYDIISNENNICYDNSSEDILISNDLSDETIHESQLDMPVDTNNNEENNKVEGDCDSFCPDIKLNHNPDYKARRESKRAALENHFLPQFINPRYLDSIKEENNEIIEKDKTNQIECVKIENSTKSINFDNLKETETSTNHDIFNTDIILEEIEPSFAEIIELADDVDDEFNSLIASNDVIDSTKTIENKTIENNEISDQLLANDFNDTDKNINIISTTLIHPTQIEKLTTNMTSYTNLNENKYYEKYKYPEPPATNEIEKPEKNLEITFQIVSPKIHNIAVEKCADKCKENSGENTEKQNKNKNNIIEKLKNNIEDNSKTIDKKMTSILQNEINSTLDLDDTQTESSKSDILPLDNPKTTANKTETSTIYDTNRINLLNDHNSQSTIKPLRLICTETLASMPYGEEVLEELADVAKSLNHLTQQHQNKISLCRFDNPLPEISKNNTNFLTNLNSSDNTIEPSVILNNYLKNKPTNDYTNSSKSISDTSTKLKDIQGCNISLSNPIDQEKSEKNENIVSSINILPKSDDAADKISLTKRLFYNNDPKNNQNILASTQNASQQTSEGSFLNNMKNSINSLFTTQKNNLNNVEQTSLNLQDTQKSFSNENNINNERIMNIEIKKSPFCSQLMQTSMKLNSDKDKLLNADERNTNNNIFFFDSCKDEDKNNLKEKFNKIMSDFKLDTKYSEGVPKTPPRREFNHININRNENKTNTKENVNNFSYDEFRRRAKETAAQRAKSEYFEREHFFKDFNRFSELYNDDFFVKLTDDKNPKEPKIVNIPIKVETNEPLHKTIPKPEEQTVLHNINMDKFKQDGKEPKITNIPISIEKSNFHEKLFKSESNISGSVPYLNKYVNRSPDNKVPLKEFETRVWSKSGKIKAPRLSGSTSSLPLAELLDTLNESNTYQSSSRRKHYISCHSLIDEKPISSYFTQLSMPSLVNTDFLKTEFDKLENDRNKLIEEMNEVHEKRRKLNKEIRASHAKSVSEDEIFRQQMRNEWLNKIAEQEERRMQKTIKISKIDVPTEDCNRDNKKLNITDEFLERVAERRSKLCMPSDSDWESGAESQPLDKNDDIVNKEKKNSDVKVIDGQKEKDLKTLPKHLVEFAEFVKKFEEEHLKELNKDFWSADQRTESDIQGGQKQPPTPPPLPLWSPKPSPTLERKEFRPVKFESPTLPRRYVQLNSAPQAPPPWSYTDINKEHKFNNRPITSSSENIKKGANIETEKIHQFKADNLDFVEPNAYTNTVQNDYMTVLESENDRSKNMAQIGRKKLEGVGPITKDGIPICLRSEIDHNNQHQWYKTMFNTLHKVHDGDDSVIIRYKSPRGRYLYKSKGYMSEPETNDSNYSTMKYTNKLGRRTGGNADDDQIYGTMSNLSQYGTYRRQPGKIEDYSPGHAIVSERKKLQQRDNRKLSPNYTEGNLSRVLKEQGYESESNLVIRKRDEPLSSPLSPVEQKQVYRSVQSGGEPPLNGFRKPAPEKQKAEKNFDCISYQQKETIPYPTHRSIVTQNSVTFLPITKILIQPPTPPNRSSSRTRTSESIKSCFNPRKSTPSSERHRRCFDNDFFTKSSEKSKSMSLRKNKCFDTLFRSQSGGAVNKIVSKTEKKLQNNGAKSPISPIMKSTTKLSKRPSSLSPIAFGRSCSKERAFAVEKRRLEESLPLCKKSFTSSTNILRDPSLKSPNEVKKAVQSFAHIHSTDKNKVAQKKLSPNFSKSIINCNEKIPCTKKKVSVVNKRKDKLIKFSYSMVSRGVDIKDMPPKTNSSLNININSRKSPTRQDKLKTNSNMSLTRTNSTFSVDSSDSKSNQNKSRIQNNTFFQNLFLRDFVPSLHSNNQTNVQEKTEYWSGVSTKSEPLLQRSRLYMSQNHSLPDTKYLSCKHQTCQRSQSLYPTQGEKQKLGKRSKSEPRPQLTLSEHSSVNNLPAILSTTDYVQDNHKNKRFSPTREIRIPVKEIQTFNTNLHDLQNQNKNFSPHIKFEINSEPYLSLTTRKKSGKSFSPTREIRIHPDEYHSYCPYSYTSKSYDNNSLSTTHKTKVKSNQIFRDEKIDRPMNLNNEICTKTPRSKSFSPTREIRICPDQNKTLCYRPIRLSSPIRKVISPSETSAYDVDIPKTVDLRSPSHRRIQSFRDNKKCDTKTIIRASSLSSADDRKKQNTTNLSKSSPRIKENKRHSTKFLDLNNFYSNIERFDQLDRATSATDLRAIGKKRNTVDYDEWKKIRAHKRAEKELTYVLRAIKQDEREKDFLFRPKELEDIKWTEFTDCGLRCKEKSVEDLRENFEKTIKGEKSHEQKLETRSKKEILKPHWRTLTVSDLATNMEEKFNSDNIRQNDRTLGFSKKIISTLSKEQIHKIKDQLNEIYSTSTSLTDDNYKCSGKNEQSSQKIQKLNYITTSRKDILDSELPSKKVQSHYSKSKKADQKLQTSKSCDRIQTKSVTKDPELNETEKRKLSKSLSQEIQTRGLELRKSKSNHVVSSDPKPKETIIEIKHDRNQSFLPSNLDPNLYRNNSCEKNTKSNELEDSNVSVQENVNKKIRYFEEIKKDVPPKTIYHAREYSSPDEEEIMRTIERKMKDKEIQENKLNLSSHKQISTSASDLKELFGENELSRINYSGPSDMIFNYTTFLDNNNSISDYNYENIPSFHNVYRSRSMSPIRERTYKKFWDNINTGSVKRIKNKFENINSELNGRNNYSNCLRKIKSDPTLNKQEVVANKTTIKPYENSDVSCITYKFETAKSPARGRPRYRKNLSPIPRVQIKKSDLMMPHIDIISKTASLKQELGKSSSIHPQLHRSGKVDRIRCKFDHCSLLSQIYTSSPDITELKDISTYLRGEWIAHKFPNKIDNNKTTNSDDSTNCNRTKTKTYRRPSSTSPRSSNVTSILKPYYNDLDNETFETIFYRPKQSYSTKNYDEQHLTGVTLKENDIVPSTPPLPSKGVTFNDNGINSETYFRCFEDIITKSPIRFECKDILQDEELAVQQRESLAKIYQKEREKKHVEELKNMNNRRHTDNFTPLHKLQIPLNRFDDFNVDFPEPKKLPKTLVKALYNFSGETDRELSFKKGDVMYARRLVDANWYEGEHNGKIGLLPANYIQVITKNDAQVTPKKISEGQGRAKFNFQAQSAFELSLNKGELVTLTRQVDENWFEGKIANRKGIFPVSYVEVLTDIGSDDLNKPFRSPNVHSNYQPSLDALRTTLNHEFNTLTNGQPANEILKETKTQILHVDTDSQPIPFRALYKYRPQNNDELELQESDIVYVLEMCDDGWYVGTSQRTGCFGTFPGNYVERI